MAITLDTTLGGELSNSYVDLDYADDYWGNHFSSVKAAQWAALNDDQKTQLLVRACSILETARYTYTNTLPQYSIHYDRRTGKVLDMNLTRDPVKFYYYQRLQFPRNLDVHFISQPAGAQYIPEAVLIAQCEQAIYLLNVDETAMANRLQGITLDKVNIGSGAIESTQEYAVTGSMFAPMAFEMLRPYMVKSGKVRRS
jgi:hypothetical protein